MRFVRRHFWTALIGLALVGGLVYAFQPQPVEVDAAQVKRGALEVTVDEDGKTRIKDRYVVSAPLAGQLLRIGLKPGATVRAGDTVLAALEPTDPALLDPRSRAEAEARVKGAEAAVQQAKAQTASAKEAYELCRRIVERMRASPRLDALSRDEFDTAAQRERIASADLRASESRERVAVFEAELTKAAFVRTRLRSTGEANSDRFEIRSPIDGAVLRVFQESAAAIASGTRLLEVGDPTDIEVEVDVLSSDAVKVRPGARARLEHWGGGPPLDGRVRLIEPAGFTKISALGVEEQRVWVIIDLLAPLKERKNLGDAYRVDARIIVWEGTDVLKVPSGALFRNRGERAVYVVRDGRARLQPIKVGQDNGVEAEVLEGLSDADVVVLHPGDRVHDGGRVKQR